MNKKRLSIYFLIFSVMFMNIINTATTQIKKPVIKKKSITELKKEAKTKQDKIKEALKKVKKTAPEKNAESKPESKPSVNQSSSIPKCLYQDGAICNICDQGYIVSTQKNACIPQIKHCSHQVDTTCLTCEKGYDLNDDKTTCDLTPGQSSSSSLINQISLSDLQRVAEIVGLPALLILKNWIQKKIKAWQAEKALKASDQIHELAKALTENGHPIQALQVVNYNKDLLSNIQNFKESIASLKKNGIDFSKVEFAKIKKIIMDLKDNPQGVAKELGIPLDKVDNLKAIIITEASPELVKIAKKISKINIKSLKTTEALDQFNALHDEFKALQKTLEPGNFRINPAIPQDELISRMSNLNNELDTFFKPTDLVKPVDPLLSPLGGFGIHAE